MMKAFLNGKPVFLAWLTHFDHELTALGCNIFADQKDPVSGILIFILFKDIGGVGTNEKHFPRYEVEEQAP